MTQMNDFPGAIPLELVYVSDFILILSLLPGCCKGAITSLPTCAALIFCLTWTHNNGAI